MSFSEEKKDSEEEAPGDAISPLNKLTEHIHSTAPSTASTTNGHVTTLADLRPATIEVKKSCNGTTQPAQYDDEDSRVRIDALHLRRFGNQNALVLDDITLSIPPQSFVAIVGASGAGKSTLVEALNGLRPAQQGVVLYNGQDFYRAFTTFSAQFGYVPQENTIHRELTVERALYYAACLRLPDDYTDKQIQQRIDEVLEDVEIAHRRSMRINKLSGGQQKRVSIAMELLSRPTIFFLDEPTSGLDPALDRKMMALLRRLADRGHTIILTTHATNNLANCDYVCFLAQGGHLAYFGPPAEAKNYFSKHDFSDMYTSIEPTGQWPDMPAQAARRYRASSDFQKYVVNVLGQGLAQYPRHQPPATKQTKQKQRNLWKQFLILTTRYLELLRNDRGNFLILLLQAPVIGLILLVMFTYEINTRAFDTQNIMQCPTTASIVTAQGYIDAPTASNPVVSTSCDRVRDFLRDDSRGQSFAHSRGEVDQVLQQFIQPGPGSDAQKVLFITAFTIIMFGCINSAREIVKELSIYRRERTISLAIGPYLCSKVVVLGTLQLLQTALLVWLVNVVDPLHQGILMPAIWEVYFTLALTSLLSTMIGLTISALVPNTDWATSVTPLLLIPQVILSGTIFPLKDWFAQVIGATIVARWAMLAMGSSIGLHSDKLGGDKLFGNDPTYHGLLYSTYSQPDAAQHLLLIWGVLVGAIVLFSGLTLYLMKQKDRRS